MDGGDQLRIWLSSDVLNRKRGAWMGPGNTGFLLLLPGLAMTIAGVVPAGQALLLDMPEKLPPPVYTATLLVFGFGLSLLGTCLAFGGRSLLFDRSQGTVTVRVMVLFPLRTTILPLECFERITVTSGNARGPFSPAPYPVQLEGAGGQRLLIQETYALAKARERAREIAAFLSVPIEDHCETAATAAPRPAETPPKP